MTLGDALREQPAHDRRGIPRWLTAVAAAEPATLAVLLLNLFTLDLRWLAALLGPVHGLAYLAVIAGFAVLRLGATPSLLAVVPGVGGLLAVRAAHRSGA